MPKIGVNLGVRSTRNFQKFIAALSFDLWPSNFCGTELKAGATICESFVHVPLIEVKESKFLQLGLGIGDEAYIISMGNYPILSSNWNLPFRSPNLGMGPDSNLSVIEKKGPKLIYIVLKGQGPRAHRLGDMNFWNLWGEISTGR